MKVRILIDGKAYEVEYDKPEDIPPDATLVDDRVQSLVLPTPPDPGTSTSTQDESKICRSPVAGIVTRLNVKAGQNVGVGDVAIIIEAMKMENNIAVPADGRVKSILVKPGDAVAAGQILIEFE
ncbi:MAG TPA: acetyl-CoA carboxylase biotin carboxyl carrier protein subunit [Candidatus Binatia bacterium]|nr:acetyl-CoA carboxylase biotin carboxyl carrier protein subunit [Candidatus Binatia bacterium]